MIEPDPFGGFNGESGFPQKVRLPPSFHGSVTSYRGPVARWLGLVGVCCGGRGGDGRRRSERGGRHGIDPERGGADLDFGQVLTIARVEQGLLALGGERLAVDEEGLDLGRRLEDVAGGDDQVGALADLERADLVGDAQDLRRGRA